MVLVYDMATEALVVVVPPRSKNKSQKRPAHNKNTTLVIPGGQHTARHPRTRTPEVPVKDDTPEVIIRSLFNHRTTL